MRFVLSNYELSCSGHPDLPILPHLLYSDHGAVYFDVKGGFSLWQDNASDYWIHPGLNNDTVFHRGLPLILHLLHQCEIAKTMWVRRL